MDLSSSLQACLFIFSILTFSLRRLKVLNKCSCVLWFSIESRNGWPWIGRREEEQEDLGIVFTFPPQITLGKFPLSYALIYRILFQFVLGQGLGLLCIHYHLSIFRVCI